MSEHQYWNPIKLATSFNTTPSYESLSDANKLDYRVNKLEETVNECNNLINLHNRNINKYSDRINKLINNSSESIKDFYEESPNYDINNMVDSLIWLSYSDKEKEIILNNDLDRYFN